MVQCSVFPAASDETFSKVWGPVEELQETLGDLPSGALGGEREAREPDYSEVLGLPSRWLVDVSLPGDSTDAFVANPR